MYNPSCPTEALENPARALWQAVFPGLGMLSVPVPMPSTTVRMLLMLRVLRVLLPT